MQHEVMSKEAVAEIRLPAAQQCERSSWRWAKSESPLMQTLQRLKRSKTAIFGLAIVSLLLVVSIAPLAVTSLHTQPRFLLRPQLLTLA